MTFEPAISAGPSSGAASFATYVNGPMPRGLREEADAMSFESFETFLDHYSPSTGPLRLGQWDCTDAERPATRLGPQARNYQATLAVGDRISTSSAKASGPLAALTEMLYERGIAVEMTAFHQLPAGENTATFICGSDGGHSEWAMGLADDPTQSALRAVIACANRLLSAA
ncbi:hypothetical protein [Mycolicibacterium tusciae]|uniref:hypothetical protein n=1 Tax=Mycolicibacterium tusciae TaxID=75922 RepID=UPI00024A3286